MKPLLVFENRYKDHKGGPHHPENPARLDACLAGLSRDNLIKEFDRIEPRRAGKDEIMLVHTPEHHSTVAATAGQEDSMLDEDTYVCAESFDTALFAVGGLLEIVDLCEPGKEERAFAFPRPPGHHATPASAMGFCLFNNIAIAARYAQKERGFERALIVDFDAHHGNGTQDIFYDDGTVGFFSTHQHPLYPGTGARGERGSGKGEGWNMNIPMIPHSSDVDYKRAYEDELAEFWEFVKPEIVLVSAGFDAHERDPLSQMKVTTAGYRWMAEFILARAAGMPCVFVLEGGYDPDALADCSNAVAKAIAQYR
ncbi:MAG: histone deacetylase [Planctomycetes bacterium]|nr:histone deacetylase [Planctomycetota bacterium]